MSIVTLFEAKAQISELVRRVASTGESAVVTVRGKPMVRIIPYTEEAPRPDVWEVRESLTAGYGASETDFAAPPREVLPIRDPFADE